MTDVAAGTAYPAATPYLIIGCGYLGRRVARRWLRDSQLVAALTRRNAEVLAAMGITPLTGDIFDPQSLRRLPAADVLLYAVGLDRSAGRSMREVYVDGLANVMEHLSPPRKVIYISSSSVYGQQDGGWVDETSPTRPQEEAGQIVLEAEQLMRERWPQAVILRLAGLYGPDRLLRRRRQLAAREPIAGDPQRWLNLVHVEDAATAVVEAARRAVPGTLYNIVDDRPLTRREYYELLARLLELPPPCFAEQAEPRANNRRIRNTLAKKELQWQLTYPDVSTGLPAAIAESAEL